jgi:phosphate transport system substrate-binding protein
MNLGKVRVILLITLCLSACGPIGPSIVVTPSSGKMPGPTPDVTAIVGEYPRVDGSTSAHPLQVLIACTLLDVPCAWTDQSILGPFTERRIGPDLFDTLTENGETVTSIWHNGTHSAYVKLINKDADFIIVARMPSEDEIRQAGIKAVKLDIRPVALDAFVFLAHVDNPVESLTLDQIRDIYTGEVTEWGELGGMGQINAYQRNPNSGSQELMEDLVMQGRRMVDAPDMIFPGMMGPINAISSDPQGIGYSVYFYASFMLPDENVKLLGVEGVVPTSETIASREYPLVTEVYAVVRADTAADSSAVMLRDWLLTDEGQETVEESGYVPIR